MAQTKVDVPGWLTNDFLKSCLESDAKNFSGISIINFTAEPAVPPGNNYGSLLFRISINYTTQSRPFDQSISLILKAPLTDGIIKSLGEDLNFVYEREYLYYNRFLTETYKLSKHCVLPIHYPSPKPLCLLMEDLRASRYTMVDRCSLLDYEHSQLYIQASAKLHAFSVAINKTNPELIQSINKQCPDVKKKLDEVSKSVTLKSFKCMAAYLEERPNCKKYLQLFDKLTENFDTFWETFQEMEKIHRPIKALVQLDPWCTNMMFKYDTSGRVSDIKLLDFQNINFTTPVTEFISFFWLSVKPEVREEKSKELYHLYCNSLNANLESLGCSERLNFEDFEAEVLSLSPLVLNLLCSLLPFCISDSEVDLNQCLTEDFSDKNVKETVFYKLYSSSTFKKYYPQILFQADREGLFQYLSEKMKL